MTTSNKVTYNGGCVIAMQGKDCIAIATDRRFGLQSHTAGEDCQKVFHLSPRLYLGLTGLQTDIMTVYNRLMYRKNVYEINEGREVSPKVLTELLSHLLYEHRFGPFFVEPVIAGLDPETLEPYICCMDLIGCANVTNDFVATGTCSDQLVGMCESVWSPNLNATELFKTIAQAMLGSFNRDAVSGWGSSIFILEKDKITERLIRTRKD